MRRETACMCVCFSACVSYSSFLVIYQINRCIGSIIDVHTLYHYLSSFSWWSVLAYCYHTQIQQNCSPAFWTLVKCLFSSWKFHWSNFTRQTHSRVQSGFEPRTGNAQWRQKGSRMIESIPILPMTKGIFTKYTWNGCGMLWVNTLYSWWTSKTSLSCDVHPVFWWGLLSCPHIVSLVGHWPPTSSQLLHWPSPEWLLQEVQSLGFLG